MNWEKIYETTYETRGRRLKQIQTWFSLSGPVLPCPDQSSRYKSGLSSDPSFHLVKIVDTATHPYRSQNIVHEIPIDALGKHQHMYSEVKRPPAWHEHWYKGIAMLVSFKLNITIYGGIINISDIRHSRHKKNGIDYGILV